MKRKFLSVLLALSMALTLLPAVALAEEVQTDPSAQANDTFTSNITAISTGGAVTTDGNATTITFGEGAVLYYAGQGTEGTSTAGRGEGYHAGVKVELPADITNVKYRKTAKWWLDKGDNQYSGGWTDWAAVTKDGDSYMELWGLVNTNYFGRFGNTETGTLYNHYEFDWNNDQTADQNVYLNITKDAKLMKDDEQVWPVSTFKPTVPQGETVAPTTKTEADTTITEAKADTTTGNKTATFDVSESSDATGVSLPKASIATAVTENVSVAVATDAGTVTLGSVALGKINSESATDAVSITVEDKKDDKTAAKPDLTGDDNAGKAVAASYDVQVKIGDNPVTWDTAANAAIKLTVDKPEGVGDVTKLEVYLDATKSDTATVAQNPADPSKIDITVPHLTVVNVVTTSASAEAVKVDKEGNTTTGAFSDLMASVADGDTITLNSDVTLGSTLVIPKNVGLTINGNGNAITAASAFTGMSLVYVGSESTAAQLTLKDVKLDANKKGRVIVANYRSTLTVQNGTMITGGQYESISGVYITGGSSFEMTGGEISGNTITGAYANDGDWQYTADLWIPSDGTGVISGGKVGNAYANANAYTPTDSVRLTVTGSGEVENVFVEAYKNNTSKVLTNNGGTIGKLLIAMDYDVNTNTDTRLTVSVDGSELTGKNVTVTALAIPDGVTATAVKRNEKNCTIANDITIGEGATLVIPNDVTVVMQQNGANIAKIENGGTIQVNGSLIAGASANEGDSDYLNITGSGTIQAGPDAVVDVDKTEGTGYKEITITLNADGGEVSPSSITALYQGTEGTTVQLPTPTRSGSYRFDGWYNGSEKITDATKFTADVTLTAQWTSTGGSSSSGGGGGGSSSNVSVSSSINGKVTSSPKNPKQGDKVTLTIAPNTGYELTSLTVKDSRGKKVTVTKNSDTEYTFTMPSGRVTVTPVFSKIEDKPPVEETKTFTDVPASAYYAEAVKWAVEQNITTGTGNNTFSPNASCTRAQTVTFLWRAAGSPAPKSGVNPFADVAPGAYYYDAVLWAVEQGITNGTGANTFSPNATVTRGQTVTFLYRAAGSPLANGGNPFADVADSAYYANAVRWAVDKGITNGTSGTTFSPNDNCIRGQIVTFLYRDRVN